MNKDRRKRLADAAAKIEEAMQTVSAVRDEESEAFDNMPEPLQSSERGEKMQDTINEIDDILSDIEAAADRLKDVAA